MRHTRSFDRSTSSEASVPFFRSRWGLLSLLAVGSGLYLYQRRGGDLKGLFGRVKDAGIRARDSISSMAPSAGERSTSDMTGDVGTFDSDSASSNRSSRRTSSSRQASPNTGV